MQEIRLHLNGYGRLEGRNLHNLWFDPLCIHSYVSCVLGLLRLEGLNLIKRRFIIDVVLKA